MPLPVWLVPLAIKGVAVVAGAVGTGKAVKGAIDMKDANDTMKIAQNMQENSVKKFENNQKSTLSVMDDLGNKELKILQSFEEFINIYEKISNKPNNSEVELENVKLPEFKAEELKEISVGAGVLLGGLGGAALGTAAGVAAAGAVTSSAAAIGVASTGTAIASLHGAALTNAVLAFLGGGAIKAGGGGMAAGAAVLGAAGAGIGLCIGGFVFSAVGKKMSEKADEAYYQATETKREVDKICVYLDKLRSYARKYLSSLTSVDNSYKRHVADLKRIVIDLGKVNYKLFSKEEKMLLQNTINLVKILKKMCSTKLVLDKSENEKEVNVREVDNNIQDATVVLESLK